MVASDGQNRRRRRGVIGAAVFVIAILATFGGWISLWQWTSDRLAAEVDATLIRLARRGADVECAGRRIGGFPFRVGLFCDSIAARLNDRHIDVSAGALRSAAQAYDPGHAVVELDGPLRIDMPRRPQLSISWASARASIRIGWSGFARASAQMRDAGLFAFDVRPLAVAVDLQAHARPGVEPDTVDLAASAAAFRLLQPDEAGPFDANLEMAIEQLPGGVAGLARIANPLAFLRDNGLRGRIDRLRLATGDGAEIVVSGPFEVGQNGVLSGQFRVTAIRPAALLRSFSGLHWLGPDVRDVIEQLSAALSLAEDRTQTDVIVADGNTRVGLLAVGRIPPLF